VPLPLWPPWAPPEEPLPLELLLHPAKSNNVQTITLFEKTTYGFVMGTFQQCGGYQGSAFEAPTYAHEWVLRNESNTQTKPATSTWRCLVRGNQGHPTVT
jgi:hypothetical protein